MKKGCGGEWYTLRGQVRRKWGNTPYPVQYTYDQHNRMTELHTFRDAAAWDGPTWPANPGTPYVTTWTYDPHTGLLQQKLYDDGHGPSYTYTDADWRQTTTFPNGLTTTREPEPRRNLVDFIDNDLAGTTISKYSYENDPVGRRTEVTKTGTAFAQPDTVTYGYNDRSEVVAADAANDPSYDYDYTYNYDSIGNRKTSSVTGAAPAPELTTYTTNPLNQYTEISTGNPPVVALPTHDLDGNMTTMPSETGDWTLEWNGENRLIVAESANTKLTFTYDYMGRRVRKRSYSGSAILGWTLETDHRFVYDGWNLIATLDAQTGSSGSLDKIYTWGLDLSQTLQGAGGVGGLLTATHHDGGTGSTYYATYDANGNVSEYLAADGTLAAHYEYSPFGQTTTQTGTTPQTFPHRFSTKYHDAEIALYYYGFRYYNQELGRWASRDPSGHFGGTNLYAFVMNFPCLKTDFLGLWWWDSDCTQMTPRMINKTDWSYTGEAAPDDSFAIGGTMVPSGSSNGAVVIYERKEIERYCCSCGTRYGERKYYTTETISPNGGAWWWVTVPGTWPPGGTGGALGAVIVEYFIDQGLTLPTGAQPGQNQIDLENAANANTPSGNSGETLGYELIPDCSNTLLGLL